MANGKEVDFVEEAFKKSKEDLGIYDLLLWKKETPLFATIKVENMYLPLIQFISGSLKIEKNRTEKCILDVINHTHTEVFKGVVYLLSIRLRPQLPFEKIN